MKLNYEGFEKYLVMEGEINGREKYGFVFDNGYGACVLRLCGLYGENRYEFALCTCDEHGVYKSTRIVDTDFDCGTRFIHGENVKKWLEKVKNLT